MIISEREREISDQHKELIDRNEDILTPLAKGRSTKQVAHEMDLHPKSLSRRVQKIRLKLGCSNLVELIHVCTVYWLGRNSTGDENGMIGG
jgi:DNA-binding NarL/FixJ family response regulator